MRFNKPVTPITKEDAQKQLHDIEASLNRTINQIRGSCIETDTKQRMVEDLNETAFEVHHLTPYDPSSND
jgi:hypothetical protein